MATGRLPDPNTAPVTAKGDLYTYSTVPAKLAVGSNGETLVADSSATTGLRWQGNFAAGKNKLINGDFNINQRNFTSNTADNAYNFDRWLQTNTGGTNTVTPQTFTVGTAPVAGYEGTNFVRCTTASQTGTTYAILYQKIESVRTFANQTVTVSFWAKAASGTPKVAVELQQNFGTGGSPSTQIFTGGTNVTISTSWARYSITYNLPSIAGKTLGTSKDDYLGVRLWYSASSEWNPNTGSIGTQNNTFDFWGVQIEAGSVATAFQTATGTLAGELAACQRYYYKHAATGANSGITPGGFYSATTLIGIVTFPITMRTSPTFSAVTGTNYYQSVRNGGTNNLNSLSQDTANANASQIFNNTEASGTAGHYANIIANNASASIAWSAEL